MGTGPKRRDRSGMGSSRGQHVRRISTRRPSSTGCRSHRHGSARSNDQGTCPAVGGMANLTVFDPMTEWVPRDAPSRRHRNSPYFGMVLRGKPMVTVYRGIVTARDGVSERRGWSHGRPERREARPTCGRRSDPWPCGARSSPRRAPSVRSSTSQGVGHFRSYGAAVAKSVSPDPWPGRKPPRAHLDGCRDAERHRNPEPG